MSEVIRATDTIIVESEESSQDLNQSRIVPRELNFDFGQFFLPNEKQKSFDIRYFRQISEGQEISAIVNPHARLGTLTTYDERIFYALIEIWLEQSKPDVCFFSERELARRIKSSWGKGGMTICDSLNRLRGVLIEWQGSFYDSAQDKFTSICQPFSILNHLKIISTRDKGIGSQIAEFRFDERVIENLNSNFSRPVLFDVILSFKRPIAQAMYTFVEPKLYGTKQYHCKTGKLIENLGLRGKSYKYKSARVQKLEALEELIGKPLGFGEVIESYKIREGKDDAVVVISRSGEEGCIKGKKGIPNREIETEVIESLESVKAQPEEQKLKQKAAEKRQEPRQKPEKPQPREIPNPTSEKPSQGESGLHGVAEVFDSMPSAPDSEALNSEALELLKYFDSVFNLNSDLNPNDVPKAELFVERYSLAAGKFLVDFAHRQESEPARFSDILGHRAEALEAFRHKPKKSEAKVIPINAVPDDLDLKAIHHFHQKFGGRIQASDKVRSKVQSLIKAHSFDFAIFLVDFVSKKISDSHSNYQPKSFNGILSSQNEALEEYEKGKRRKQQEKRLAQKLAEVKHENARLDHEKAYRGDYYEYVNELVCSLGDEYPDRFNEFRCWQAEQRREKENLEGNLREVSLRVFDSEGQIILRLAQFFKNDRNIHIPDFWEWDSTKNPNSFS